MIISLRVFSGTFSRTDVHFRPSQAQVEENIKAMEFGPLQKEQMNQIDDILKDIKGVTES